jgi:hypothetical protein
MTLSASWKGALLGAANVLAVATCIAIRLAHGPRTIGDPEELGYIAPVRPDEAFILVLMLGLGPGILAGVGLAKIARGVTAPAHVRLFVLALPALLMVLVLGVLTAQFHLIAPALLPTAIAVVALERWVRPRELVY